MISKEPFECINTEILSKMFKDTKKFNLTNKSLAELREQIRPKVVETLQEGFSYETVLTKNNHQDIKIKFLNQFYVWNGMNKFLENQIKQDALGDKKLTEQDKEEIKKNIRLINSNLDKREHELMKVFDCNTDWPLCLFDFTFKNRSNQYLTMKPKPGLTQYI